jgi:hypothetical protein
MISRSGQASRKVVSEYHSTGFPPKGRNCFGSSVPMRKPEPPATMTAYFFIPPILRQLAEELIPPPLLRAFLLFVVYDYNTLLFMLAAVFSLVALLPRCLVDFFYSNFNKLKKGCFSRYLLLFTLWRCDTTAVQL